MSRKSRRRKNKLKRIRYRGSPTSFKQEYSYTWKYSEAKLWLDRGWIVESKKTGILEIDGVWKQLC